MMMEILAPAILAMAMPAGTADAAVRDLVARFEASRRDFDPVALGATLAADYEEISPIGTVDSRADVLGFYNPAARVVAPPMRDDEVVVRVQGNVALATLRQSFGPAGGPIRAIRVRYVARLDHGGWRLTSAQYTPIPPARSH